jgi:hypothetical protein
MHVTARARRELFTVCLAQSVDARTTIFATNFAVCITAAIV